MAQDDGITSAILLQHMQAMEKRLLDEIHGNASKEDVAFLAARVTTIEKKLDLVSVQLDNIDARLDDLEVVQVPTLKKAVGMR